MSTKTVFNPPSNSQRDVRVTARESIRMPFVAPDLSPVRVIDQELEKGLQGWTDLDVVIESSDPNYHVSVGMADRQIQVNYEGLRPVKAPATTARVRHPRPTTRRW